MLVTLVTKEIVELGKDYIRRNGSIVTILELVRSSGTGYDYTIVAKERGSQALNRYFLQSTGNLEIGRDHPLDLMKLSSSKPIFDSVVDVSSAFVFMQARETELRQEGK